jgi:uncharacterized DUF497 family protein
MRITYDPAKRQKTLDERGLDFEDAPAVFAGALPSRSRTPVRIMAKRASSVSAIWPVVSS